jgi:hypothetical protein
VLLCTSAHVVQMFSVVSITVQESTQGCDCSTGCSHLHHFQVTVTCQSHHRHSSLWLVIAGVGVQVPAPPFEPAVPRVNPTTSHASVHFRDTLMLSSLKKVGKRPSLASPLSGRQLSAVADSTVSRPATARAPHSGLNSINPTPF